MWDDSKKTLKKSYNITHKLIIKFVRFIIFYLYSLKSLQTQLTIDIYIYTPHKKIVKRDSN